MKNEMYRVYVKGVIVGSYYSMQQAVESTGVWYAAGYTAEDVVVQKGFLETEEEAEEEAGNQNKGEKAVKERYDYLKAMVEDIKEYISEEINASDYEDREALEETLHDDLWIEDSVTGNASGFYTFNSYKAKGYVMDNMELCKEVIEEFCIDAETVADKFLSENWEWFDVTIRCYLLSQAISKALDEIELVYGGEEQ